MNTTSTVTTDASGRPTATPQPKVVAATVGAGAGAAITTLGVYIFETTTGQDLPQLVEGAILTLVSLGLAFLAGYIKRPSVAAS